ncbi:hypothetical protein AAFF_G00423800 [Aldrovandia affinis]|uniref:Uncharacterized protein n=1 Tax=Aldrovandia affinis TaxID=143900 RepID=A0AAD7T6U1_9TELE|nr:hypothetical protein AAFF_G00423800 [Aldrovandia affinis]
MWSAVAEPCQSAWHANNGRNSPLFVWLRIQPRWIPTASFPLNRQDFHKHLLFQTPRSQKARSLIASRGGGPWRASEVGAVEQDLVPSLAGDGSVKAAGERSWEARWHSALPLITELKRSAGGSPAVRIGR